jgi:MoxR-like ATPase
MSRIYALLDGRYNVSYDDINKCVLTCLSHRLYLNFEAMADGVTVESILEELVKVSS